MVVSQPCSIGGAAEDRPSEHDLLDMATSGYLDSLGYDYKPASPDKAFREPSKVVENFLPAT